MEKKTVINLSEETLDLIKIWFMFSLIIIMIILSIVIWKYGAAIKSNPCDFCDCSYRIMKGGIG